MNLLNMLLLAASPLPLAAYCLNLALINRRMRPLLVSGAWDFAGVLLGASGFLVFGGVLVLSQLSGMASLHLQYTDAANGIADAPSGLAASRQSMLWGGYFILVFSLAIFLIWWHHTFTIIYNVDPSTLDNILARVLNNVGLAWKRSGDTILLLQNREHSGQQDLYAQEIHARSTPQVAVTAVEPPQVSAVEPPLVVLPASSRIGWAKPLMVIDPSYSLFNVTLRWQEATPAMRRQIERELIRLLAGVRTLDNPLSGWFFFVGALFFTCTFVIIALCLAVLLLGQ